MDNLMNDWLAGHSPMNAISINLLQQGPSIKIEESDRGYTVIILN